MVSGRRLGTDQEDLPLNSLLSSMPASAEKKAFAKLVSYLRYIKLVRV